MYRNYSFSFQRPERLFTFGSSREGAYSFFFRETTECSKQNLNTVFIKKKDNNKKPEQ